MQNNQTGDKTYFRIGGAPSSTAVDIYGQAPGSFIGVQFGDIDKSIMIGSGGWLASGMSAPTALGMHTFVMEVRDQTGGRVVKSAYAKIRRRQRHGHSVGQHYVQSNARQYPGLQPERRRHRAERSNFDD